MLISPLIKNFLNLIYPLQCASCQKRLDPMNEAGVCEACLAGIKRAVKLIPDKRGHFIVYSACFYEGPLKKIVSGFKYKNRAQLGNLLSNIMVDLLKNDREPLNGADAVIFVPLHGRRLRERGYNQSRLLAQKVSKEFGIPLVEAIVKTKATRPQNELSRNDRLTNLKGAFKIRSGFKVEGLGLLLIDDVMTTGATLGECVKVLISAGAKSVACYTLARGA